MPPKYQRQIQCSYKSLSNTIKTIQSAPHTPINILRVNEGLNTRPSRSNKSKTSPKKQSLLAPLPTQKYLSKNPYKNKCSSTSSTPSTDLAISSVQTKLSLTNQLDNKWIGHRLRSPLPSHARIWIQNVNGLNISHNFNPYLEHLEHMKRYNIHFLALTETHLNNQNIYIKDNLVASHKMIYPEGHVIITNTPTTDYDDTCQSGDILSSTQNRLSNRYAGGGSDLGGRYTWMDFYGKDIFLRIYTVYRVCNNSDNLAGDNQAWTLQREWLQRKGVHTNPRSQVLQDLKHAITVDITKQRQVLVVGDFNENVLGSRGEAVTCFQDLGLVNVLKLNLFIPEKSRSYSRGSSVIDGIWATPYIQQRTISCGLAPFDYLYPSDHRGLFMDIDILDLLDAREVNTQPPAYRRLKHTIPKRVTAYCSEVKKNG